MAEGQPRLFEAVPNFSEGRDPAKVERIAGRVRAVPGVRVLGLTSDADHNRSVLTLAGEEEPLLEAATALARACAEEIDLSTQTGEHPRVGSLDVLPFVPLEGATLEDAARLARRAGERIGGLGFGVYLYESAATAPHRRNLAEIRRGGYEGLAARAGEEGWRPDYGPAELNPALGAVVVGARPFLVAYNAFLDTADVGVARDIAARLRERDGGMLGVKAIGLPVAGKAQVSMNLVDLSKTSLPTAVERVRELAAERGARVESTELIGLMPLEALLQTARHHLALPALEPGDVLEYRMRLPDRPSGTTSGE
ncbi:glutamate formimidoyltransferase [Rubrobacter aplysinae]|uniref:glutamate formimidoyltransferase n=1 Tax=Rubrobacter aplysinae TaxID=909625 RepID=UPI00064B9822|nr:glutamate formimidoyltransferase [Rubrobacter aplysinae]